MSWYFLHRSNIAQRDDFPKIVLKETRNLPVPLVDTASRRQKSNRLCELVNGMVELQKQAKNSKTEHQRSVLDRQIEATDQQIDKLVYDLYGLTQEEIAIVESTVESVAPVRALLTVDSQPEGRN